MPHLLSQVTGRHEENVDVIDLENVVEILDPQRILDHHHDHRLVIGCLRIIAATVTAT